MTAARTLQFLQGNEMPLEDILPYRIARILIFMLLSLSSLSASSTDFFLRPTSLSMVEEWTPQMSFFVSNPSDRTIVLKVDTRQRGPALASDKTKEVALKALPAEIVLKAGERKIIRLEYVWERMPRSKHFEVVVEQLPILYLKPGDEELPETMLVTRYVAEVEVRPRQTRSHYAMTGFGRALETGYPVVANAQK